MDDLSKTSDRPELETLSYKSAESSSAFKEKNIPIIEPEIGARKSKVADQPIKRPKCGHNWATKGLIKVCIYCGAVDEIDLKK